MDRKLCLNGCFRVLPVSAFGRHPRTQDGLASRCKACEADRLMLAKHGLTRADKILAAENQAGCAICGRLEPTAKGWVVDHDRSCCSGDRSCPSCRRGILCAPCNSSLGYAEDDPVRLRRMADYLELGTRISELQVEMPSPPVNTDGQDGQTNEDGGYSCESLSVVTARGDDQ